MIIPEAEAEQKQEAINQAKLNYVYKKEQMENYQGYDAEPHALP